MTIRQTCRENFHSWIVGWCPGRITSMAVALGMKASKSRSRRHCTRAICGGSGIGGQGLNPASLTSGHSARRDHWSCASRRAFFGRNYSAVATAMTVRQATIEDLDVISPLFDAYRQFYRESGRPGRGATIPLAAFRAQPVRHLPCLRWIIRHRIHPVVSELLVHGDGSNPDLE